MVTCVSHCWHWVVVDRVREVDLEWSKACSRQWRGHKGIQRRKGEGIEGWKRQREGKAGVIIR